MRIPIVAGNWKMHNTVAEARELVAAMGRRLHAIQGVEKVLCPPFPALLAVAALLEGTDIRLGAQNMHWERAGAFTGEVSPPMVAEFCQYVILGHSERRAWFGETDATVNRKVHAAFAHGLTPILCVGETLDERQAGRTAEVVGRQVREGLQGISPTDAQRLVIAYEPVWAIGTGHAATPELAGEVIGTVIRPALAEMFGEQTAQAVRVQYGGSVKPENAAGFFAHPEIDGALVGGASLKADAFVSIVQQAQNSAP